MEAQLEHTLHTQFFAHFGVDLFAQSVLSNKISASELSRNFIKCALLVGTQQANKITIFLQLLLVRLRLHHLIEAWGPFSPSVKQGKKVWKLWTRTSIFFVTHTHTHGMPTTTRAHGTQVNETEEGAWIIHTISQKKKKHSSSSSS